MGLISEFLFLPLPSTSNGKSVLASGEGGGCTTAVTESTLLTTNTEPFRKHVEGALAYATGSTAEMNTGCSVGCIGHASKGRW